jgi:hypothetical protein
VVESKATDLQLTSLSVSDIMHMTLLGDESFYPCESVDRLLALGETYARDYGRLLDAGTRLRLENERLRRDLQIQAVNAAAVLQAQRERDDHRVRLREAIEIIRSKATSSEWAWTVEVEGEIAADDPRRPPPPDTLVDAVHERVHEDTGEARAAVAVRHPDVPQTQSTKGE